MQEVNRVLKPDGYFSFCDLRSKTVTIETKQIFQNSKLKIVKEEIITEAVVCPLDKISERKTNVIKANVPNWIRKAFKDLTGVIDSKVYNAFKSGGIVYVSYVLKK